MRRELRRQQDGVPRSGAGIRTTPILMRPTGCAVGCVRGLVCAVSQAWSGSCRKSSGGLPPRPAVPWGCASLHHSPGRHPALANLDWFSNEVCRLYGFSVPGVDYTDAVETDVPWPTLTV